MKPLTDNPRMLQSDWIHFVTEPNILHISSAFCRIGSAFHMTGMGIANWVEPQLPKMPLAVASCSFSAKANGYDRK